MQAAFCNRVCNLLNLLTRSAMKGNKKTMKTGIKNNYESRAKEIRTTNAGKTMQDAVDCQIYKAHH